MYVCCLNKWSGRIHYNSAGPFVSTTRRQRLVDWNRVMQCDPKVMQICTLNHFCPLPLGERPRR
jgi:hypothetical protein